MRRVGLSNPPTFPRSIQLQDQQRTRKQKLSDFFGYTVLPDRQCLKLLQNTHRNPGGAGKGQEVAAMEIYRRVG